MCTIFAGIVNSNKISIFKSLISLTLMFFVINANAFQPFHEKNGYLRGYEDENYTATSGLEWSELPRYGISASSPARINSHVSRTIYIRANGDSTGDYMLFKYIHPNGEVSEDKSASWTGSCWSLPFYNACIKPGWTIEKAIYVSNVIGTWSIETYDVSAGIETLVSAESFEVKGREMQISNGANLIVYENDNLDEPLSVKLIDYDHVSGAANKQINFEIINKPKGKANGGLNFIHQQQATAGGIDNLDITTNNAGIASVFFVSGSKPGTYTIRATTYWAPETPLEFQVTVKAGKDPDKEDDLVTELIASGRNNGEPKQCDGLVANPINVITGNKFQKEVDYQGDGFMPLEFIRYYNSTSDIISALGPKWSHSYSRFIKTTTQLIDGVEQTVAKVYRDDGKIVTFYKQRKAWLPMYSDVVETLTLSSKKWRFNTRQDTVEVYHQLGRLESITHADGNSYTLEYNDADKLSGIYNPRGRSITLSYTDGKLKRAAGVYYTYFNRDNGMLSRAESFNENMDYHYEDEKSPALLTGITDQTGNRIATWQYNENSQAITSFHGDNVDLTQIDYLQDGSRVVTHPDGQASQYQAINQLGLGLLNDINGPTCSSGSASQKLFNYDPITNNLLSKTIDNITTVYGDYDQKGNPGYIIEAHGTSKQRRTDFTYDARFFNKVTRIVQPSVATGRNKTSLFNYDDKGHLIQQTDQGFTPEGAAIERTTRFEYNGTLNQLSLMDGPRTDINDVHLFNYHPLNIGAVNSSMLKDVIAPDGNALITDITYTYGDKVARSVNGNGLTTQTLFSKYLPVTITRSFNEVSRTTHIAYTPSKLVESITTAANSAESTTVYFNYDSAQRLIKVSNQIGEYIEFVLDNQGNVAQQNTYDQQGNLQQQISNVFDSYNHLTQTSSAEEIIKSAYNANGDLQQQIDGNNVVTDYTYDQLSRLATIAYDTSGSDPTTANTQNHIAYDVHNNQTQRTDANGNITEYSFDDFGNLLTEISPDRGVSRFTYDAAGNRLSVIDAKQQHFVYQFDALNRLLSIDTAGSIDDTFYVYDLCSNGVGKLCSIDKANTKLTYSYNGFGDVVSHTQTINAQSNQVDYTYNLAGNIATITYPSGVQIEYQYDVTGAVQTVNMQQNGISTNITTNAQYNFNGALTQLQFANGLAINNTFDLAGKVTNSSNGPLAYDYGFDGAANIISQASTQLANQSDHQFGYDAVNRLTQVDTPTGEQSYTYDTNSNRQTLNQSTTVANTITTYGIALESNLLSSINGITITHDGNGNTLQHHGQQLSYSPQNQLLHYGTSASYQYNGLGQRVTKTNHLTATSKQFIYSSNGMLLAEISANGDVEQEHVYLGGMPIAVIKHSTNAPNTAEVFYVHTDHLNTPRAITNSQSIAVWHWQSDAFGNKEANQDVDLDGTSFVYNKRFPGQYYDNESGLHYNYYRDYNPQTGRYLQSDPIGLTGGMNTFGYVGGNPMVYSDPKGLIQWVGRIEGGSAGIGQFRLGGYKGRAVLKSECKDGQQLNVKVSLSGGGYSWGFPWSLTASKITLEDPYDFISANNLVGDFKMGGANLVALLGYGYSSVQIGTAFASGDGVVVGVDASIYDFVGQATISDASISKCECDG